MSDADAYRKVGRGGAGNFYAAPKADEASKDLEAQDLGTSVVPPPDRSSAQVPARAGRGGAGNYVDPGSLPDAREMDEMADKTAAAVSASLKQGGGRHGYGGRGGAGNWRVDEEEARRTAEAAKGEQLDKKAVDDVEQGLKMPERVHHGGSKDSA